MHLITGRSGTDHITSANDGFKNSMIFGKEMYIFDAEGDFYPLKVNNNTVQISKGQGIMNGRLFEAIESTELKFTNGTQGQKRKDLIVARYEKNPNTAIEKCDLVVITGVPDADNPQRPQHNEGNILNGDKLVDFPLYEVNFNGTEMSPDFVRLFDYSTGADIAGAVAKVEKVFDEATQRIEEEVDKVVDGRFIGYDERLDEGTYNLIHFPYHDGDSFTHNGITYTANADGSITANGTATATSYYGIAIQSEYSLKQGTKYAISNGNNTNVKMYIQKSTGDFASITDGKTKTFTCNDTWRNIGLYISKNTTLNNEVVYPMLVEVNADGSYPTKYVRGSIMSNRELTDRATGGIVDMIYPVGSIYMSVNNVSPETLFGGSWEQIKDKFLLSSGDTYSGGSTGGSATHTLAEGNLPSHRHSIPALSGSTNKTGSHVHSYAIRVTKYQEAGIQTGATNCTQWFDLNYDSTLGSGDHTHTVTTTANNTGYTGSGNAVNHMPPYLAVYMWKRTA